MGPKVTIDSSTMMNKVFEVIEAKWLFDVEPSQIQDLVFEKPNLEKFDCLRLAFEAIKKGHSYQVALNATNEVLVDAFLNKKITYTRNSKRN